MYAVLGTLIAAFVTSILVYVIGVLEISTVFININILIKIIY